MKKVNRRKFLQAGASAASAAVLAPLAFPRFARASDASTKLTGTIKDVKHVVVLMQENRSFDHYFGTLKGVRGFSDQATILLPGLRSVFEQPNGNKRQFPFPLRGDDGEHDPEVLAQCQGDIPHSWADQHKAWNDGRLDRWMEAKKKIGALSYLDRTDLPFYYALADAYTICDAYHASGLTATGPNRTFLWSGSIDAAGASNGPAHDGGSESGLKWATYAEALERAGISWRVYQNSKDNYGNNGLAYFSKFASAAEGSSLYKRGMSDVPAATGDTPRDIIAAIRHDVVGGTLPQVSWVVTDAATCEHPIGPPVNGENFVHELLQALNADPDVLDSTVVLINYDENGGFFDHVPPPVAPDGTAGEFVDGQPVGLGFRVPMLVLSPWTRGGWVSSEVFDHTSVIRFLERWTKAIGKSAPCSQIGAWRRKVCGDLTSVFDFEAPVFGLPSLPEPGPRISIGTCKPLPNPTPKKNTRPKQEAGKRPARALPYQPNAGVSELKFMADDRIQILITMTNEGPYATRAAHFAVYANAFRDGGPWQYTVPAYDSKADQNGSVTDFFNVGKTFGEGAYDLSVVGPNRFLRRIVGDAGAPGKDLEVTSTYSVDPATGQTTIAFALRNDTSRAAVFVIEANAYRSGEAVSTFSVPAGSVGHASFDQTSARGWYDLTVSSNLDAGWSRRFAGHMENGVASVSG